MSVSGLQNQYSSLLEALENAENRGFVNHFNFDGKQLRCVENGKVYSPNQIVVRQFHRFEGASDPDESAIIYLVETNDGLRGTVINAYGTYADPAVDRFMQYVPIENELQHHASPLNFV